MCFLKMATNFLQKTIMHQMIKKQQEKAAQQQAYQQALAKVQSLKLQEKKELLDRQRNAVADRNIQTAENVIKDNSANNIKRNLGTLNVPLLRTWGTGSNGDENIGAIGLNLGGSQ